LSTVAIAPVSCISVSWSLPRLPTRALSSGYTFKTDERREVVRPGSCVGNRLSCGLCASVRQPSGRHDRHDLREEVYRAGLCLLLMVADVGPEPDARGPGGHSPSTLPRKTVARLCCARWRTARLLGEGRWADEWSTWVALWDISCCAALRNPVQLSSERLMNGDPWCTGWSAERPSS
jgi:hypothetical protein